MDISEVLDVTCRVAGVLDRLGVEYLVGGALASSFHGIPRATRDVDVVAGLETRHIAHFVSELEHFGFHVNADEVRAAVAERSSFNIIHLDTMLKVDVFLTTPDEASRQEMKRRATCVVSEQPRREIVLASAEDTVARKLQWYRMGGAVSERQWSDVIGILRVQKGRLDAAYLDDLSQLLGVEDLLSKALAEAGLNEKA